MYIRVHPYRYQLLATSVQVFEQSCDFGTVRIVCLRGDTFQFYTQLIDEVSGVPLDLSAGIDIQMQVRRNISATSVLFSFSTADSTASVFDAPNGIILINQTATLTAAWPIGEFVFDMQVVFATGETVTVVAGEIEIQKDVTRTD